MLIVHSPDRGKLQATSRKLHPVPQVTTLLYYTDFQLFTKSVVRSIQSIDDSYYVSTYCQQRTESQQFENQDMIPLIFLMVRLRNGTKINTHS